MGAIERVGVIGGGTMGSGIAELMAVAGCRVTLVDIDESAVAAGHQRVEASLSKALARDKIDQAGHDESLARLDVATSVAALADHDLVVEAIVEDEAVKRSLFADLDGVLPVGAVMATNTSSIPIATIATATSRPESVVGMHFFNPAPVQRLVEITPSLLTDDAVVERLDEFATGTLAKTVIHAPDQGGFVVNKLLVPYLLSAIRMLEAGEATAEDIDTGMMLGCAHPMGPLALCDLIGLDVIDQITGALYTEYADPVYAAPPLLRRMVTAGLLGRKSGRGFFEY